MSVKTDALPRDSRRRTADVGFGEPSGDVGDQGRAENARKVESQRAARVADGRWEELRQSSFRVDRRSGPSAVRRATGHVSGIFCGASEIRPESNEAGKELHRLGIQVAMISGDSKTVANSVAQRIGIDEVAAEVLPADKASAVKRFQAGGKRVAMVGDGVNDAPALATADVGIAIGAGTDVAIESAGIVLVRSDPRDVVGAIELSRATYKKMIQNLVWATAYNLVAIPVAAGLFVRWGLDLPMSVGAIAMSLSTIIVAANAQLLRRLNLQRAPV